MQRKENSTLGVYRAVFKSARQNMETSKDEAACFSFRARKEMQRTASLSLLIHIPAFLFGFFLIDKVK